MSLLLNKFVISNNKKNASTFTSQGNERVNLKNHILWFNFLLIIHTNYMAVYIRTSAERDCSSPSAVFSFNNFRCRNFHYVLFLISHYGPKEPPKQQGNQYNCCHFPPSLVHSSFYLKFISFLETI